MFEPMATVVLPARNAAKTIAVQLAALAQQSIADELEILVVDNGSTDDTAAVARSWRDRLPGLRVIDASGQSGASFARNTGIAAARSERILLCDADDRVGAGWAGHLLDALSTVDAVAGRVLEWEADPDPDSDSDSSSFERRFGFLPAFGTNNAALRKPAWEAVGGFDETMPAAEDIDLSWRMQLAGFAFGREPRAVVFARPRTTAWDVFRQTCEYGRNEVRLYCKYRSAGMPDTSTRTGIRKLASLVRHAGYLLASESDRRLWCARAGWRCGRLAGSFRERVLHL